MIYIYQNISYIHVLRQEVLNLTHWALAVKYLEGLENAYWMYSVENVSSFSAEQILCS